MGEPQCGRPTQDMPAWAIDALGSLKATVESSEPRFPCLYGARALRTGTLRYAIVPGTDDAGLDHLASVLRAYVDYAREQAGVSSLLAVFPPDSEQLALEDYRSRFWNVLQRLHERDSSPWPSHIPRDPQTQPWEFCFAGEAIFVFAACPAYVRRRSRNTRTFTIAFQPRHMFDRLFEKPVQLERARELIRRRALDFDDVSGHPDMGLYYEPDNREWRQYVVPDTNEPLQGTCPFRVTNRPDRADAEHPPIAAAQRA
ncbi:MAG TPA: YqcI/YcgG family protein [Solirubrobacteraceae bacterium]|nr:YqcI/YcgG family protein [Solirubrobacteraceae bacterium]